MSSIPSWWRSLWHSILVFGVLLPAPAGWAGDWRLVLDVENDVIVGHDRHYTSGVSVSSISPPLRIAHPEKRWYLWLPPFGSRTTELRWGVTLAQKIYTPEDYTAKTQIERDRPYAGWLYIGFSVYGELTGSEEDPAPAAARLDSLEMDLGIVGPGAGAREIQNSLHGIGDSPKFQGWDQQLSNEFGFILRSSRRWRIPREPLQPLGLDFDIVPHVTVELGNVSTGLKSGGILRLGHGLPRDFGRGRVARRVSGSRTRSLSAYVFAGAEGWIVLRNIFLDGNTFRDSHHVPKEILVGRLETGVGVELWKLRGALSLVWTSDEFKQQREPDTFGRLILAVDF